MGWWGFCGTRARRTPSNAAPAGTGRGTKPRENREAWHSGGDVVRERARAPGRRQSEAASHGATI
eukprot:424742-Pyramimonas_sp.AAC.1